MKKSLKGKERTAKSEETLDNNAQCLCDPRSMSSINIRSEKSYSVVLVSVIDALIISTYDYCGVMLQSV